MILTKRINLDIDKFKNIATDMKIIHLSDLHISQMGCREAELVSLVNREKSDVILITGDMVVSYKNDFSACIQTLQRLNAKHGIFAVLGNAEHTFNPIRHLHDFTNRLKDVNVTLLNNRNIALGVNGRKLYLIGVDDPFFHFDNFEEAIKGVPFQAPTILLAHSPDILFGRTDAMAINLLDSPFKKDHFKEWGWEDSTHFSSDDGNVYFQKDGEQTLRVQSRQDGVSLDTILLNPYDDIDNMLAKRNFQKIDRFFTTGNAVSNYPDLIMIPASKVDHDRIYGKWKKTYDKSTLFGYRLDDFPPQRNWQYQPLIDPIDYFEVDFAARKDVRYRVWIRMRAYNGSPQNDSVYIQFDHSVDQSGEEKYRIGKPAYCKDRLRGVDLILTGHTHGGQIRIPFFGPVLTMTSVGKRYASGLHRLGKSTLYVSRGVGTSKFPLRLFCPPEIAVFSFN